MLILNNLNEGSAKAEYRVQASKIVCRGDDQKLRLEIVYPESDARRVLRVAEKMDELKIIPEVLIANEDVLSRVELCLNVSPVNLSFLEKIHSIALVLRDQIEPSRVFDFEMSMTSKVDARTFLPFYELLGKDPATSLIFSKRTSEEGYEPIWQRDNVTFVDISNHRLH